MARTFAGGTDKIQYQNGGWNHQIGAIHFRFKTTQTTANTVPLSLWGGSRNGFGFILNNTLNKLTVQGYAATGPKVNITCTTTVNDGNWHSGGFNWNTANGAANTLFIDGVSEATGNSSTAWPISATSIPLTLGRDDDGFWASYVGVAAELAVWFNRQLTADEFVALHKGYSPLLIYPPNLAAATGLNFYAPLVRDPKQIFNATITGPTGTSVSDHPRVIGL